MPPSYSAVFEPSWRAIVIARRPLWYAEGADDLADRPAHVRAGSSLAWLGGHLALVQDDANFIALIAPDHSHARAIDLPRGDGGLRQFDDTRGNKAHKLDLEACVTISHDGNDTLVAFGSGSGARREQVIIVEDALSLSPRVAVVDAGALYAALRAEPAFAGSDMNIEGAMMHGDRLRLFGRGNGTSRDGNVARNATCDLDAVSLLTWLGHPLGAPPPAPRHIVQYELGALDGIALGFTDAVPWGAHALYTAAAEDSPDATRDGAVTGSVAGLLPLGGGAPRHAVITDADGAPFAEKVEGIARHPHDPSRAFIVIDRDDPARPSELCELQFVGNWGG